MTKKQTSLDYPRLAGMLYNNPLAIHPDKLATIEAIFQSYIKGEIPLIDAQAELDANAAQERHAIDIGALAIREGYTTEKPYVLTEGGTAVIPVIGTLVHRAGFLDALSGMTSYRSLQRRVEHAGMNTSVKGIVLELDTGGGEVAGLFEFADTLLAILEVKPVWTNVNEQAFSAGYAIASATGRILGPKTSKTGSIGVLATHVDQSEADSKKGLKITYIKAGEHKDDFSTHKPLNQAAIDRAQSMVNESYGIFVAHVATGRGIPEQTVRDTEAQIYTIREAIELGLADQVATLDDTVAELESTYGRGSLVSLNSRADRANTTEVSNMKLQVINAAGLNAELITQALAASGYEVEFITAESLQAQAGKIALTLESVKAEHSEIASLLKTEGADQERERIKGVYDAKMPGHEKLIEGLMFDGTTTGGEAASQILAAHKNALAQAGKDLDTDAEQPNAVTSEEPADTNTGAGTETGKAKFDPEQCKADWEANRENCQDEFTSFDTYRHFKKAEASGKVKILRQTG